MVALMLRIEDKMKKFEQLIEAIRSVKDGNLEPISLPAQGQTAELIEAINEIYPNKSTLSKRWLKKTIDLRPYQKSLK